MLSNNIFSLTEQSNKNIVIQGFNGTGKTRFALHYAKLQEKFYDAIFYMASTELSSLKTLRNSLIIIDDIDYFFDKRNWSEKTQKAQMNELSKLLGRTRHNNCTYILISRLSELNSFLLNKSSIMAHVFPLGTKYIKYYFIDSSNYKYKTKIYEMQKLPSSWNLETALHTITFMN